MGGRKTSTHDDAHHSGKSTGSQFLYIIMLKEKRKMKETRFQEVLQSSVTPVHFLNPLRI